MAAWAVAGCGPAGKRLARETKKDAAGATPRSDSCQPPGPKHTYFAVKSKFSWSGVARGLYARGAFRAI